MHCHKRIKYVFWMKSYVTASKTITVWLKDSQDKAMGTQDRIIE